MWLTSLQVRTALAKVAGLRPLDKAHKSASWGKGSKPPNLGHTLLCVLCIPFVYPFQLSVRVDIRHYMCFRGSSQWPDFNSSVSDHPNRPGRPRDGCTGFPACTLHPAPPCCGLYPSLCLGPSIQGGRHGVVACSVFERSCDVCQVRPLPAAHGARRGPPWRAARPAGTMGAYSSGSGAGNLRERGRQGGFWGAPPAARGWPASPASLCCVCV